MNSAVIHAEPMHSPLFLHSKQHSHYQPNLNKHNAMLIPHHLPLLLLLLPGLLPHALAQNSLTDCEPVLIPLAPCGPFVQARAAAPVKACCDNVGMLYKRNLTCLCVLLASSGSVSPFPINVSLALQLPLLCKLNNVDHSSCPGISLPSPSPPTQVSLGAKPKSGSAGEISATPMITRSPTPRFMGFGFHQSADQVRLKAESRLLLLLLAAIYIHN